MDNRWIEELFIEYGDTYAEALASLKAQTGDEVEFLASQLEANGVSPGSRVLDLACGIGRHSLGLADLGYEVTGVDISPVFIEWARGEATQRDLRGSTDFRVGDMRRIDELLEGQQFDAILSLFTSFGFYDDETNRDILDRCRAIASDGGVFVIDVSNRDWIVSNFSPQGFMAFGPVVVLEEHEFDPETSVSRSHWMLLEKQGDTAWEQSGDTQIKVRQYALHELIDLFDNTGWNHLETFGGLSGEQFDLEASRITAVFEGR